MKKLSYDLKAILGNEGGWWPVVAAVASAYSAWESSKNQQEANAENKKQAEKQMKFQKEMSNTSHAREVEDLRKAGLNPILSANGGASTPSGASATFQPVEQKLGEALTSSAKLSFEKKALDANLKNTEASTAKTLADTLKTSADIKTAADTQNLLKAQTAVQQTQAKILQKEVPFADLKEKAGNTLNKFAAPVLDTFQNAAKGFNRFMESPAEKRQRIQDAFNAAKQKRVKHY